MNANSIAWMLLLLPFLVAITILPGRKRLPGLCALLATGSALIALVLALLLSLTELGQGEVRPIPWIVSGESEGSFRIIIGLELDRLSRGMIIAVTGIGFVVHLFTLIRMKDDDKQSPPFVELTLFLFAATGIVLSDSLVMMLFFWGLVSFISYLILGQQHEPKRAKESFLAKLLLTRFSDCAFLLGLLFVWSATKSIYFRDLPVTFDEEGSRTWLNERILFIFYGVLGMSFHTAWNVWPSHKNDERRAFSHLIHAGSLILLGAYSVVRLAPYLGMVGAYSKALLWAIGVVVLIILARFGKKLIPSKT